MLVLVVVITAAKLSGATPGDQLFEYVLENEVYVNSEGKNVVVFFGETQIGKSTTINALRGMHFDHDRRGRVVPLFVPFDTDDSATMGTSDQGGVGMTAFPRTYASPFDDWVYIDTRGFLDVRKDDDRDAAAQILLEIGLNKAKSVRFVVLDDYHTIERGAVHCQFLGEVLSQVILNPAQAPILFVYNRFNCPEGVECPKVEPNRSLYIIDLIKEHEKAMWRQMTNGIWLVSEKINKTHHGAGGRVQMEYNQNVTLSPLGHHLEVEKIRETHSYLTMLQSNFNAGRIAYFDPTSLDSIRDLRKKLRQLEPIGRDQFDFYATNEGRRVFTHKLREFLGPLNAVLSARVDALRFPNAVIDACEERIRRRIEAGEHSLRILEGPDEIENAGEIRRIEEEFNLPFSQEVRDRKRNLEDDVQILEREIRSMETKTEIVFNCSWNIPDGIALVHRHTCQYTAGIPYIKAEEQLSEGTTRISHIETDREFHVTYTSADALRTGKEFIGTVVTSTTGAISGMFKMFEITKMMDDFCFLFDLPQVSVLGDIEYLLNEIAPWVPANIYNNYVTAALTFTELGVGISTIANAVILVGATGAAFGFVKGLAQSTVWSRASAGQVILRAYSKYLPDNLRMLQNNREKLEEWTQEIQNCEEYLNKALRDKDAEPKQKVAARINLERTRLVSLARVRRFHEEVKNHFRVREQEIESYARLLLKLPDRGQETLDRFRKHWKELAEARPVVVDYTNDEEVNDLFYAVTDAARLGAIEFRTWKLLEESST
jgi:hypothetical protein